MPLISSLLFGFSTSIDAFLIGMTYGVKRTDISFLKNIVVSLITLTGTAAAILIGMTFISLFPARAAQLTGCCILVLLGIYYVMKFTILSLRGRSLRNKDGGTDPSVGAASLTHTESDISFREAALLGVALSVNNMGIGIGASISGIHFLPTILITFAFSICFLYAGNRFGKIRFFQKAGHYGDAAAGLVLIILGIYEGFI